jgi:hypothetical protein
MPPDSNVCPAHSGLVAEIRSANQKLDLLISIVEPRDIEQTIAGKCLALVGRFFTLIRPMATPSAGVLLAAAVLAAVLSGTGLQFVSDILSIEAPAAEAPRADENAGSGNDLEDAVESAPDALPESEP